MHIRSNHKDLARQGLGQSLRKDLWYASYSELQNIDFTSKRLGSLMPQSGAVLETPFICPHYRHKPLMIQSIAISTSPTTNQSNGTISDISLLLPVHQTSSAHSACYPLPTASGRTKPGPVSTGSWRIRPHISGSRPRLTWQWLGG